MGLNHPGATSNFLFLVVMPGAPNRVLAPSDINGSHVETWPGIAMEPRHPTDGFVSASGGFSN